MLSTLINVIPSTAMRLAYTPVMGEMVYDAQLQTVYIGDGATAGGKLLPVLSTGGAGERFQVTGTLTSAAAATAVTLLADSVVGTGRKVYITDWFVSVSAATAWTDITATIVSIKDNAAVSAIIFAKAGLTDKAMLYPGSANTTYGTMIPGQSGLTSGRGLNVVADAVFAAGSDLKVTVMGFIK